MLYLAEIFRDSRFLPFFWAFEISRFSGISVVIYKGAVRLAGKQFGKKSLLCRSGKHPQDRGVPPSLFPAEIVRRNGFRIEDMGLYSKVISSIQTVLDPGESSCPFKPENIKYINRT